MDIWLSTEGSGESLLADIQEYESAGEVLEKIGKGEGWTMVVEGEEVDRSIAISRLGVVGGSEVILRPQERYEIMHARKLVQSGERLKQLGKLSRSTDIVECCSTQDFIMVRQMFKSETNTQEELDWAETLSSFSHPNLLHVIGTYKSSGILTEYCRKGSVYEFIAHQPDFSSEEFGADVIRQLLSATLHVHEQGITNLGIDLQNIFFSEDEGVFKLKLRFSATPCTPPPEYYSGHKTGPSIDIWAIGCLAHELHNRGRTCWYAGGPGTILSLRRAVEAGGVSIPGHFSPSLASFIACCTVKDPSLRATCDQLLDHPWLQ
eukprot:TRINITY_DN24967_c0_g1_i1.p1 TRINITY_DN24967_c0_g1~~TRINITY_DN24967_c0_g1_i1.p1  ORF type:complete len:320 (+),score=20.49 TRINITY_DN24967_c0_g1_i1:48-1007(+)